MLPRLPSGLIVFTVRCRKNNTEDVSDYIDFRVRRDRVHRWLVFLQKWSPVYKDVIISDSNLNQLPEDGSVYNHLSCLNGKLNEIGDQCDVSHKNQPIESSDEEDDRCLGSDDGPAIQDDDIDILHTGIGEEATVRCEMDLIQEKIVPWPEREDTPNDEYNTSYLLASSFPNSFSLRYR